MLRSLGGGQIKKKHKNNGGQSQSFKNNNNKITRPSMIGSPERVKIQRSLVQNLS